MKNAIYILGVFAFLSCTKTEPFPFESRGDPVCFDCDLLKENYLDSNEHATRLGEAFKNPYLLPNMRQAYRNVYRREADLKVTHLYLKLSPRNFDELNQLEELDIDWYDYPLDRVLISEGDYYEQPGKLPEDIPDFYAVVEKSQAIPPGVKTEVLAEMNIPDNDPSLENEALRLTNTLYDYGLYGPKSKATVPPATTLQNMDCGASPSGIVMVEQSLLDNRSNHPLPGVRIVIRRLFKTERLYTDESGRFSAKKYFRNKYTILAKFKNQKAHISRTRPRRIFEQVFPIKMNLGKWDNLDCNHKFIIPYVPRSGTVATSHWCAATTSHTIWNYHQLCTKFSISPPPLSLRIILSHKKGANHGNTYMLRSIMKDNRAAAVSGEVLLLGALTSMGPVTAAATLAATEFIKSKSPDIHYGYGGNPSFLTTDRYSELVYHELAHASHYAAVGTVWWAKFGIAEAKNEGEGTYGSCCTQKAAVIALGEGWAYLVGHLFADHDYGSSSTPFPEQGNIDEHSNVLTFVNHPGVSSHIHFLESFNPARKEDPSYWVPKGLFYDLLDADKETFSASGITDNVRGYTCKHIFSLMGSDTRDIHEFKSKFLETYGGSQKTGIEELFRQYGY